MKALPLDGKWNLTHCKLGAGEGLGYADRRNWKGESFDARVPGQVHTDLVRAGRIPEPLEAINTEKCLWMESEEWWHQRTLRIPRGFGGRKVELIFDGLDTVADVYWDGERIGHHENMHRPLVLDVTDRIRAGATVNLAVRTDPGLGSLEGKDGVRYKSWGPEKRLSWLRRAQFSLGWDWAPRLATTGIWRSVRLVAWPKWQLRDLFAHTRLRKNKAVVTVSADAANLTGDAAEAVLKVTLTGPAGETHSAASAPLRLAPGKARTLQAKVEVSDPQLWWPRHYGAQPLYRCEAVLTVGGRREEALETRIGLREVAIEQKPLRKGETSFTVCVNGERIYCKGANWVPADSIMSRVSDRKYRDLVRLAAGANFNMLRIWGGGIFEDDAFYNACDEQGILLWHDFMYACAFYPDDDPAFAAEAEREAEAALRRLRNHPCIALWCGNNENDWFDYNAIHHEKRKDHFFGGRKIYHEILPGAVKRLDPSRPYWPSSPYGSGDPNAEHDGDRHAWNVSILHPDEDYRLDFRNYLKERGKFNSEYGILAPPTRPTLDMILAKKDIHPKSKGWAHHNNRFEKKNIQGMLKRFYRDPRKLSFDEYLLASQMIQAEALRLSLDAFRVRKFENSGAMFWMYNDCWGAVGWTIVDYYLNLKPAWYYVRDANAPVRVAAWAYEGLTATLLNDTRDAWTGTLVTQAIRFDGETVYHEEAPVTIPANGTATVDVSAIPADKRLARQGCVVFRLMEGKREVNRARVFLDLFKNLQLPEAAVRVRIDGRKMTFESDVFTWMVHLELPTGAAATDNAFDLLPGEAKTVRITGVDPKDIKIRALSPARFRKV